MNRQTVLQIGKAYDLIYDLVARKKFDLDSKENDFFFDIGAEICEYMADKGYQVVLRGKKERCRFKKGDGD